MIDGSNFVGVEEIRFNNSPAIFTVLSDEKVAATVPIDATSGPISAITAFGTAVSFSRFAVAPRIISFSPASGSAGTLVIIEGANFLGTTAVTFNGRNAAAFTVIGETQLHAVVPAGASSGLLRVITTAGDAFSANDFVITGTGPVITDFSPTNGMPGAVVTIEGRNFTAATAVRFNGVNAANFTVTAPTQIRATVPSGAVTGPISVTGASGTGVSAKPFVVTASPILTDFLPLGGPPGTLVVIDGANFMGATAVKFNGINAASFSVTSESQISAVVPSGATTGPISVMTPKGTGASSTAFQVRTDPVISSFSPVSGLPGTVVTIDGFNFLGSNAVKFGTNNARFQIVASTQISAIVPSGALTAAISVTTPNGVGVSSNQFVVTTGLPVITSFSPAAGLAGTSVVLEGFNFLGATAVKFNGTNAQFTVTAATQIVCTVPPDATTGPISVTTPLGTGFSALKFIAAPSIAGFSPTSGSAGAGVVIRGTNFTDLIAVKFNGIAADFSNPWAHEIRATVPLDATTGTISITTPAGVVATTNAFTVLPTQPILSIERTPDNRIAIAWPAAATNFVLQATDRFSRPAPWTTITNTAVVSGFRKVVTVPAGRENRFYRLSKP